MKLFALVVGTLVCLATNAAFAEPADKKPEAVEIPLKDIWACGMPGTQELTKSKDAEGAKQLAEIQRVLSKPPQQSKEAGEGFIVLGDQLDALREAHSVLFDGKKRHQVVPADEQVTLVFFSHLCGQYVHLQKVSRRGNAVDIHYRFEPHKTKEITQHLALIPLVGIKPGAVHVNIVRDPMPEEFVKAGWKPVSPEVANSVVCKSFTFQVE